MRLTRARRRLGRPCPGRELLVAEDGQAFLQRQLEPVAAGDAVAGPVVEVLVADHASIARSRRRWRWRGLASTYLVLKMFRPLFSIAPMLKSLDRDDHEALEIERQAEARLVPHHRGDQRVHRVLGLVEVAAAHEDLQQVLLAGAARDALLARDEVGGDQREQVATASGTGRASARSGGRCRARPARPGCRWTAAPGTSPCRRAA